MATPTTRYGIVNGLRSAGAKVDEEELCHLHRSRTEATACERGRAPWLQEHDLLMVARARNGAWTVTESASDEVAGRTKR